MRLIDADELLNSTIYNPLHAPYITKRDVINAPTIKATVDAVPVVRCKDCKYLHMETEFCKSCIEVKTRGIWFCADGERRGGNG